MSQKSVFACNRRKFIGMTSGISLTAGVGALFGTPPIYPEGKKFKKPKTNFHMVKDAPRKKYSLPGLFPGKVVEIEHDKVAKDRLVQPEVVNDMIEVGMHQLTGKSGIEAWKLFVDKDDVVGIKVNPVGGKIFSTHPEIVDVVIKKLLQLGVPKKNIIIWDRFSQMLSMAGYTKERFPGIELAGLQIMDMKMGDGWKDEKGEHKSKKNFDPDVSYWVDVEAPKDDKYLNQHVFNGKDSFFGNLVTKRLTKIINVAVFKNTGNGVSMSTKNIGYGVIANTNRLHKPLFFDVNVEVCGFPAVRDKLVLNILDGIKGQYDGGPMANAKFIYPANKILFATDAFAQDYIGHAEIMKKRKADPNVKFNDSPRFTEYFRYADSLGLGVGYLNKIKHEKVKMG